MIQSIAQQRGVVAFPEFTGERIYMQPFFQHEGLPKAMGRWQPTVDAMLEGIVTDKPIYLMVDQGIVMPRTTHRRPGVHVDGYWNPGTGRHGHRSISAHNGRGIPSHNGNQREPTREQERDRHTGLLRYSAGSQGWEEIDFSHPEAIILASDVSACIAYTGEYDEQLLAEGGDASRICIDAMDLHVFDAHQVYAGNVALLHASVPVAAETKRTLVRLNVPGWTP